MSTLLITLAVIVVVILVIGGMYNKLVSLRNRYKNAFAQIDVQLKRRYDLIPNLVETAKAYIKHERETLEAVIAARSQAMDISRKVAGSNLGAQEIKAIAGAEGALSGALGRLMAVSESYPELKANQNMMQLTEELTSTENKIAFARQGFNDSVTTYNTAIEHFPSNIIASFFAFKPTSLLEIEEKKEREAVSISF